MRIERETMIDEMSLEELKAEIEHERKRSSYYKFEYDGLKYLIDQDEKLEKLKAELKEAQDQTAEAFAKNRLILKMYSTLKKEISDALFSH